MNFRAPVMLSAMFLLAACNNEATDTPEPDPSASAAPSPDAPVSIIRPEIEQPELPVIPLETLEVSIGFPEGGTQLDASATAALEAILVAEQVTAGGPITLRAHSDAGGNDAANLRASQARGDRVKEWLVEKGLSEDRITVIAFGEQNPVEPNALPDGSANEAGRAANRRVDVEVAVIDVEAPEIEPTPEPAD